MALRNHTRTTVAERAAWLAGYAAALSRLAHRRVKPTYVGRLCTEHADVALENYRARFTKGITR